MKKIISGLVTMAFFLSAIAYGEQLTILHFNDFHGKFDPLKVDGKEIGGAARLATVVRKIEAENSKKGVPTLLFFGGDAFTGSIISRAFEGAAEIRLFNEIGVDVMVIGNHEFDMGNKNLTARISEGVFPVLSANTFWKNGKPFAPATHVVTTNNGLKIGILGLTTQETPITTSPKQVKELTFKNTLEIAKKRWQVLNNNSDVQIALTHQGVEADKKLAAAMPNFEAIIGGHDHVKPQDYCRTVGNMPVCQTPPHATYLGRVDLEIEGRQLKSFDTKLIPIDKKIRKDKKVDQLVKDYGKVVDKKYGLIVGKAGEKFSHDRGHESPMGNIVADAIRERFRTDVGIVNSGGIRRPFQKGNISLKDVFEILPFDNSLVLLGMKGIDLVKMLDFSASHAGGGGFLQVSGVQFKIENKKTKNILINGQPVDPQKIYTVTTIDFIADGGDGYNFLKGEKEHTDILIRDAVTDYIKKVKVLTKPNGGRIIEL